MADVNRQVVLVKRPIGMVSDSCFELPEGPIPPGVAIGEAVRSNGGGVVVASKTGHLRLGSVAMALTGWQDYCVTSFDIPDVFRNATEPGPPAGTSRRGSSNGVQFGKPDSVCPVPCEGLPAVDPGTDPP